jgi:hypothetical protein
MQHSSFQSPQGSIKPLVPFVASEGPCPPWAGGVLASLLIDGGERERFSSHSKAHSHIGAHYESTIRFLNIIQDPEPPK